MTNGLQPYSGSDGTEPERPGGPRRRLPRWIVLVVLVAIVGAIALFGGYSGSQTSIDEADPLAQNPGMAMTMPDRNAPSTRFLVERLPESTQQQAAARSKALGELGADAVVVEDDWAAIETAEPQTVEEVEQRLIGTGVHDVRIDPPRWRFAIDRAPLAAEQWYLDQESDFDADGVDNRTFGDGAGVTVAVIDSGVSPVRELDGVLLQGRNVNEYGDPNDWADDPAAPHGTAVASLIAAQGVRMDGIAPGVKILPVRVFEGDYATSADIARGIDYAVNNGADIINLSLGCQAPRADWTQASCYSPLERRAIERAGERGVLVVAAAGNYGLDNDQYPTFPANYALDNIISVGAADRDGAITAFSNFGEQSVHVAAPGQEILVATPGNGSAVWDGTSFAAPLIAGLAASAKSANPNLSLAQLRETVLRSSEPDDRLGGIVAMGGMPSAVAAAQRTVNANGPLPVPGPEAFGGPDLVEIPRTPSLASPRARTTTGAGGRPRLRWAMDKGAEVSAVVVSQYRETYSFAAAGKVLAFNTDGADWFLAPKSVNSYRPKRLSAGSYWWQVVLSWQNDEWGAYGDVASPIRKFTVAETLSVRKRSPKARAGSKTVRIPVRLRSNAEYVRVTGTVNAPGQRRARKSQVKNTPRSKLGKWRTVTVKVKTRKKLRRGDRVRVTIKVAGTGKSKTYRRTIRVR